MLKEAEEQILETSVSQIVGAAQWANSIRRDAPSDELERIVEHFTRVLEGVFDPVRVRLLIEQIASDVSVLNREQVGRQLRMILGTDFPDDDDSIREELAAFAVANWLLVRAMRSTLISDLAQMAAGTIREGIGDREVRGMIRDRFKRAGRRGALIARNEVGTLLGQLNRMRQRAAGITHYTWITMLDERVRKEHAERHGETFSWDDPPEDGHPGMPPNCRCVATPVVV